MDLKVNCDLDSEKKIKKEVQTILVNITTETFTIDLQKNINPNKSKVSLRMSVLLDKEAEIRQVN